MKNKYLGKKHIKSIAKSNALFKNDDIQEYNILLSQKEILNKLTSERHNKVQKLKNLILLV